MAAVLLFFFLFVCLFMASVTSNENALYKTNYHTIQYNLIQYNSIQCSKIQCNTIHYNAMLCNTIQSIRIKYKARQDRIRYMRQEKIR